MENAATLEIVFADHTYTATVVKAEDLLGYLANEERPYRLGEFRMASSRDRKVVDRMLELTSLVRVLEKLLPKSLALTEAEQWAAMSPEDKKRFANDHVAIKVGQQVTLNDKVRPRYMAGLSGTVEKINSKSLLMCFGQDAGRFAGKSVRVPHTLIKR